MQGVRLDDVDFPAEEVLEVHLKRAEVDQRGGGAELHEEIDVAGRVSLAACEGAKDFQAARPVSGRESEDLLAFRLKERIKNGALDDGPWAEPPGSMIPAPRPASGSPGGGGPPGTQSQSSGLFSSADFRATLGDLAGAKM